MQALRFVAEAQCRVQPEELWPLLADTNRLNRAIGLPAVQFSSSPRADGGTIATGEVRKLGITLARWREHTFDFERPCRYSVVREYSAGPFIRFKGGVDLTPLPNGTLVQVSSEIIPRNPLGWLLAKYLVGPTATSRVLAQCRLFEAYLRDARVDPFPQLQAPRAAADERRLGELAERLIAEGSDPAIVGRLCEHLRTAADDQVARMRPLELADAWGTDRHATLVVFLRATTVGLLDLRWEVLCPNCRVPKAEYASLSELRLQTHCDTCNIAFDANFDRLVEVRFRASPAIREADVGVYCIGGPQNMPHVVAQAELEPGGSAQWRLRLGPSTLRLRSAQCAGAALMEVVEPAAGLSPSGPLAQDCSFLVKRDGIAPPLGQVAAGVVSIQLASGLDGPATVVLEEQFWPETAATAALVSTLQEFRDLFSSEVLAPELQVGIERLTLLFTDLAGSTALYERIGQARAFRLVHEHFALIEQAVRAHRGAMVKTIGDAVMAVFPTSLQALHAAIDMQRAMRRLEAGAADPARLLKVGIHAGPCLAVTLNDRLDYFGTAVNIAARVEHEARGGEIVLTRVAWQEPGIADLLAAEGIAAEATEVQLRGIAEPIGIFRIPNPMIEPGAEAAPGLSVREESPLSS